MKRHGLILLMVALLILPVFTVMLTSCGGKEVKRQMGLTDAERARLEAERLARERARQEEEARLRALELERQRRAAAREAFLNDHVHYAFDSSEILPEAEVRLREKADFLAKNANMTIMIEGHCDERGTDKYNMALGDRRAMASKTFLESLGVSGGRMKTMSFGFHQPLDPGHNEEAWAKNRRAQFKIESE